jgi:phage terminase large subunit-like protein
VTDIDRDRAIELAAEVQRRANYKIRRYFPDDGPFARALYPKHLELFAAGAKHRERLMLAANRVGKTEAGGYEVTTHLTGEYPSWWEGRRFTHHVSAWAAGDTSKTVRDIVQEKLLGPFNAFGTGFIPAHLIEGRTMKAGIPKAIETVAVRHVSGGMSTLHLKSYDQRREAFQGTAQHIIWLDEEPPNDIYTECVLRTMETGDFEGGIMLMTFTPLQGMTPLVLDFLPGGALEQPA